MKLTLLFPFAGLFLSISSHAALLSDGTNQITIDPQTLAISWQKNGLTYPINQAQPTHLAESVTEQKTRLHWTWPEEKITAQATLDNGELTLTFNAEKETQLNWFSLPNQQTSELLMPFNEGMRIPTDSPLWIHYLADQYSGSNTTIDLKMPFWSQKTLPVAQDKTVKKPFPIYVNWLLLNPYNNELQFSENSAENKLEMTASHTFNTLNTNDAFSVSITLGNDILSGAHRYRQYRKQQGLYESLEQKMTNNKDGEKIIGASHVYLFGNDLLSTNDVSDWWGLLDWLFKKPQNPLLPYLDSEAKTLAHLQKGQDWITRYQKQLLITNINAALNRYIPVQGNVEDSDHIKQQYKAAQKRKQYVANTASDYLVNSANWGQGLSKKGIQTLANAGLKKLWLGLGKWTPAFYQPQAVALAKQSGYLIGSYDSYNTAIPKGVNDTWLSAQLPTSMRKECAIVLKDGSIKSGFRGNGAYLNPDCGRDIVENRISQIIQYSGFNSLFLDVDGTGMVRDDYSPSRMMSQKEMASAFNDRMHWVSQNLNVTLGTEDGNAITTKGVIFAHGMETVGFGWTDKEMTKNRQSPYYLGRWYPDHKPEYFFKTAKIKQPYKTLFFSPEFKVPLYQAVFHDEIINSHHWHSDSLKFPELQGVRDIASMLYNTPPMVHLSQDDTTKVTSPRIKALLHYQTGFMPIHQELWNKQLSKFEYLSEDKLLQRTTYNDGSTITANFDLKPRKASTQTIPAMAIYALLGKKEMTWQSKTFKK